MWSLLFSRVINVYPCAYLINYYREPARHIPKNQQHALWFSGEHYLWSISFFYIIFGVNSYTSSQVHSWSTGPGLRGAMAFALSLQSVTDLPDNHGRVLLTSTLFTIFFTVNTINIIHCDHIQGYQEIRLYT